LSKCFLKLEKELGYYGVGEGYSCDLTDGDADPDYVESS